MPARVAALAELTSCRPSAPAWRSSAAETPSQRQTMVSSGMAAQSAAVTGYSRAVSAANRRSAASRALAARSAPGGGGGRLEVGGRGGRGQLAARDRGPHAGDLGHLPGRVDAGHGGAAEAVQARVDVAQLVLGAVGAEQPEQLGGGPEAEPDGQGVDGAAPRAGTIEGDLADTPDPRAAAATR